MRKAISRKRRSDAMKKSWARRKYDKEMSIPNACANLTNESLRYRKMIPSFEPKIEVVTTFDNYAIIKVK